MKCLLLVPEETPSKIFRSCTEAVAETNIRHGIFEIQPFGQNLIVNISCEVKDSSELGLAKLDISLKEEVFISDSKYLSPFSYQHEFFYGEGSTDDSFLKGFLNNVENGCTQEMVFENFKTLVNAHKFIFYDGLEIKANESPDKICKCFIREACLKANNSDTECSFGQFSYLKKDKGELSVKSSRLPLKKLFLGDIDGSNKNIKFELKSLKCPFRLQFVSQEYPLQKIDCKTDEFVKFKDILIDGNNHTCIKYDSPFNQLRYVSLRNVQKIQLVDNANFSDDIIYDIRSKDGLKCEKEKKLFTCPFPYSKVFIEIIKKNQHFQYELCEIRIIQ